MLVAKLYPFHVLQVDEIGIPILNLDSRDLLGQSVLKILGPKSDQALFVSTILEAANLGSARSQFIVYDRSGEERRAIVSFRPFYESSGVICCQVTIDPSEAITLDDGFEDSRCPYALLAAEDPHCVMQVNDGFLSKFRCTRAQAVGAAFARFEGPGQSCWDPLLEATLRGKIARERVHTSASLPPAQDDAICVPVVAALNGMIRYILVLFSPCTPLCRPVALRPNPHHRFHSSPICCNYDSALAMAISGSIQSLPFSTLSNILFMMTPWPALLQSFTSDNPLPPHPLQNQHAQGAHAGASLEKVSRLGPERDECPPPPESNGPPAAVTPRRSLRPRRSTVVVTQELLGTLAGLPLPRAAAAVDMSISTFKKACRKLGLAHWDYQRGPGRSTCCSPEQPLAAHRSSSAASAVAALSPVGFSALEDGRCCAAAPRSQLLAFCARAGRSVPQLRF